MRDELRARWSEIATSFATPFRSLAHRIANHPSDDFELLWLLADFAQLCVRYTSLLVLSYGYHNPDDDHAVFDTTARRDLRRPTAGTWTAFLRSALHALILKSVQLPFDGLLALSDKGNFARLRRLVEERNTLAHGAVGRFDVSTAKVDELSELVLEVAKAFNRVCSREPVALNDRLHWTSDQRTAVGQPLHPFVVRAADDPIPHLFDSIDHEQVLFTSPHGRGVPDATVTADVLNYLRSGPNEAKRAETIKINKYELIGRSRSAVATWRYHVSMDFFATDQYFDELPAYAGRPAFGERVCTAIASAPGGQTINLYGGRGSGKRLFLADLFAELVANEHIIATAHEIENARKLSTAFNDSLAVAGDFDQLATLVHAWFPQSKLVLLLPRLSSFPGVGEARAVVDRLLTLPDRFASVCLIMMTDDVDPGERPGAFAHRYTPLRMPRMEIESTSRFFERVMAKPRHSPLTDWELLPETAQEVLGSPSDLVTFCHTYDLRAVDDQFKVPSYRLERWNALLASAPQSADVQPLLQKIATAMRRAKTDRIKRYQIFARATEGERQAEETLQRSGYLIIDDEVRFSEFEWLVRSLVLSITESGSAIEHNATALIEESAGFPPIGKAFAVALGHRPASAIRTVFESIVGNRRLENRAALVQGVLECAYSHDDTSLFVELTERALADANADACSGCAAMAQQLVRDGSKDAVTDGRSLYEACLAAAERHGLAELDAVVRHQFTLLCVDDLREQERTFWKIVTATRASTFTDLRHAAVNNWASAAIRLSIDPVRISEELASVASIAVTMHNWSHALTTAQLLALTSLAPPVCDRVRAVTLSESAVQLSQRFGSYADEAHACDFQATILKRSNRLADAVAQEEQAVGLARLAAQSLDEAQFRSRLATLLLEQAESTDPDTSERLLGDALSHCRAAKRVLGELASGDRLVRRARGAAWWDTARIFLRLGSVSSALQAAEKSHESFEAADDLESARSVREWISHLQRSEDSRSQSDGA